MKGRVWNRTIPVRTIIWVIRHLSSRIARLTCSGSCVCSMLYVAMVDRVVPAGVGFSLRPCAAALCDKVTVSLNPEVNDEFICHHC